jgi:AcrR family transcriptional regulator
MPTPSRTSLQEIIEAGRELIEAGGLEGLSMQKVASSVGVRAPSLYKHVQSRGELVRHIIEDVVNDLTRALENAVTGEDDEQDLKALAKTFRSFATANPESYRLMFAPIPDEWRPERSLLATASEPVLRATQAMVGSARALEGARLVTAWAHGFVSMELAGAFRLDGDLDDAFQFGIERLVVGLSAG